MILNVLRGRMHTLSSKLPFLIIDCPFLSVFFWVLQKKHCDIHSFFVSQGRWSVLLFQLQTFHAFDWSFYPSSTFYSVRHFLPLLQISFLNLLSRFSVVLKAGNKYVPAWSGNMWEPDRVFRSRQGSQLGNKIQLSLVLAVQDSSSAQTLCVLIIKSGSGDDRHICWSRLQYGNLTSAEHV